MKEIRLTVNQKTITQQIDPKMRLVDLIRETLNLKGTHIGCETVQCGACTVIKDGKCIKSCSVLAMQCSGSDITTVEGLGDYAKDQFHPVQTAFQDSHALQCGFCTPGMITSVISLLDKYKGRLDDLTDEVIRHELDSNLCRCTGYQNIIKAVNKAKDLMSETDTSV